MIIRNKEVDRLVESTRVQDTLVENTPVENTLVEDTLVVVGSKAVVEVVHK